MYKACSYLKEKKEAVPEKAEAYGGFDYSVTCVVSGQVRQEPE